MSTPDEIPISTLTDARGLVELGLVAASALQEIGVAVFGSTAERVDEILPQIRAQCLSQMRHQAHSLGGSAIAGASFSVTVTSIPNADVVIAVHGTGTAVKNNDDES